jgi:hypothetical protein
MEMIISKLGCISLLVLLGSPFVSALVFFGIPSAGSEWTSGYNKILPTFFTLFFCLIASLIMSGISLYISDDYRKSAYLTVIVSAVLVSKLYFYYKPWR